MTPLALTAILLAPAAPPLPRVDFRAPAEAARWALRHDLTAAPTPGGLALTPAGPDPYLIGPAYDFPPGVPLVARLRLRCPEGGAAQLFASTGDITEERSVRFGVSASADVQEIPIPLPPQGPGARLRFDPPGEGVTTLESLTFDARSPIAPPAWPAPSGARVPAGVPHLRAGRAELRHGGGIGAWELLLDGVTVATGHDRPLIGYRAGAAVRWLPLAPAAVSVGRDSLAAVSRTPDPDGGTWTLTQTFAASGPEAIRVEAAVACDRPRELVFAPLLVTLPGRFGAGPGKSQGLFAGLEYLGDELSSSNADLDGPAALRRVPDPLKLTMPLMAVSAGGRWVAVTWRTDPETAAWFDAPDRVLGGGASAIGLVAPGAGPGRRIDGETLPFIPLPLAAGQVLGGQAELWAGDGDTVVPAIRRYVATRGLPTVPAIPSRRDAARLAAAGWLDTPLRTGALFRHATAMPGFAPQPAADAGWMAHWLAERVESDRLEKRLREASRAALSAVPPPQWATAGVGHVPYPVAGLLAQNPLPGTEALRARAKATLDGIPADGVVRYAAVPSKPDLGRTQPGREANGLIGASVATALRDATWSGDRALIDRAVAACRLLGRFDGGVPRGAQTWEVPLHTPDILAAAHLVSAFTRAYELTGEEWFRERAVYWAWTGVPFVYLRDPAPGPVGRYAGIAVLGATQYTAPVWMGLPVQWCALAYADALRHLEPHDPDGPWATLRVGITASALQQVYPSRAKSRGLLPDSFDPRTQTRNPADINPGTLHPLMMALYDRLPAGTALPLRASGVVACGLGSVTPDADAPRLAAVTVTPWTFDTVSLVLHGVGGPPRVTVNGAPLALTPALTAGLGRGTLVVPVRGRSAVRVEW